MAKVKIICAYCGKEKLIELGEYNFWVRRGRTEFFCCRACAAKYKNAPRKKDMTRTLVCPTCNKSFVTDKHYEVTFCSRVCASKGSVTDYRRQRMSEGGKLSQLIRPNTTESVQKLLRRREAWKYVRVKEFLDSISEPHEFEVALGNFVFDLALTDRKILVEFDGSYHKNGHQIESDKLKEATATDAGWKLVRVVTGDNCEIPEDSIRSLLESSNI